MNMRMKLTLAIVVALVLVPTGFLLADTSSNPPCPVGSVSGTVVAVDEVTGLVTIDQGEAGLCEVSLGDTSDASHPITRLLGRYFGQASLADLLAALEDTQVLVLCESAGGPDTVVTTAQSSVSV